jgi:hypothetical protein
MEFNVTKWTETDRFTLIFWGYIIGLIIVIPASYLAQIKE